MEELTLNALRAVIEGDARAEEVPALGGPLLARLEPEGWKWLCWYWRWRGGAWLHRLALVASGVPDSVGDFAHPAEVAALASEMAAAYHTVEGSRDTAFALMEALPSDRYGAPEMDALIRLWWGPQSPAHRLAERKGVAGELWRRLGLDGWTAEDVAPLFDGSSPDFHYGDWEALFLGLLRVPPWEPDVPGGGAAGREARFWRDRYEDTVFQQGELPALRGECERALGMARGEGRPDAVQAVLKLLYACERAAAAGAGLTLYCD